MTPSRRNKEENRRNSDEKNTLCVLTLALFCAVGAGCRPNIIDKPDDEYEVNLNVDKNISETLTILVPSNDGGLEESYIER